MSVTTRPQRPARVPAFTLSPSHNNQWLNIHGTHAGAHLGYCRPNADHPENFDIAVVVYAESGANVGGDWIRNVVKNQLNPTIRAALQTAFTRRRSMKEPKGRCPAFKSDQRLELLAYYDDRDPPFRVIKHRKSADPKTHALAILILKARSTQNTRRKPTSWPSTSCCRSPFCCARSISPDMPTSSAWPDSSTFRNPPWRYVCTRSPRFLQRELSTGAVPAAGQPPGPFLTALTSRWESLHHHLSRLRHPPPGNFGTNPSRSDYDQENRTAVAFCNLNDTFKRILRSPKTMSPAPATRQILGTRILD